MRCLTLDPEVKNPMAAWAGVYAARSSGSRRECCSAYGVPLLSAVLVAFALKMSLTSLVEAALAAAAS